jgi:hypothetical protein
VWRECTASESSVLREKRKEKREKRKEKREKRKEEEEEKKDEYNKKSIMLEKWAAVKLMLISATHKPSKQVDTKTLEVIKILHLSILATQAIAR